MEHKTRGGMSSNNKRAFPNHTCLAHLAFPCACLKNAKNLGLFCRQACTELRMIVSLVDLKGVINIT